MWPKTNNARKSFQAFSLMVLWNIFLFSLKFHSWLFFFSLCIQKNFWLNHSCNRCGVSYWIFIPPFLLPLTNVESSFCRHHSCHRKTRWRRMYVISQHVVVTALACFALSLIFLLFISLYWLHYSLVTYSSHCWSGLQLLDIGYHHLLINRMGSVHDMTCLGFVKMYLAKTKHILYSYIPSIVFNLVNASEFPLGSWLEFKIYFYGCEHLTTGLCNNALTGGSDRI